MPLLTVLERVIYFQKMSVIMQVGTRQLAYGVKTAALPWWIVNVNQPVMMVESGCFQFNHLEHIVD